MIPEAAYAAAMAALARREGHVARLPDWRPAERRPVREAVLATLRARGPGTAEGVRCRIGHADQDVREALAALEAEGAVRSRMSRGQRLWEAVPHSRRHAPQRHGAGAGGGGTGRDGRGQRTGATGRF